MAMSCPICRAPFTRPRREVLWRQMATERYLGDRYMILMSQGEFIEFFSAELFDELTFGPPYWKMRPHPFWMSFYQAGRSQRRHPYRFWFCRDLRFRLQFEHFGHIEWEDADWYTVWRLIGTSVIFARKGTRFGAQLALLAPR